MTRRLANFPENKTELDPETTDYTVRKVGKGCIIDVYIQSRLTKSGVLNFLSKGGRIGKKLVLSEAGKGWKLANKLSGEPVAILSEVPGNGGLVINISFQSEDFDAGANAENEIRKRFLVPANQTVHFMESEIAPLPESSNLNLQREESRVVAATEYITTETRTATVNTITYTLQDPPVIPGSSANAIDRNKKEINKLGLRIRFLPIPEKPEVTIGGQKLRPKNVAKLFNPNNNQDQVIIAFIRTEESGKPVGHVLYRNPGFADFDRLCNLITLA